MDSKRDFSVYGIVSKFWATAETTRLKGPVSVKGQNTPVVTV